MIETFIRAPLLAYPLGFAIAVMLPNWRSLGVAAAILAIPFASLLAWVYAGAIAAPGGAAIGAWLLFLLLTILGGGLVCGVATRALLLGLRKRAVSPIAKAMVLLLGFFLVPAIVKLYSWHREQDRVPPSAECIARDYPFRIVGVTYRLPASPGIFISVGNGSHYSMASNRSLKELCRHSNSAAGAAMPVVAVSFNSYRMRNTNDPLRIQYCSRQVGILASSLCRQSSARTEGLLDLNLYSVDEYDHKRMIISSQGAHPTLLSQQAKDLESRVDTPRARRCTGKPLKWLLGSTRQQMAKRSGRTLHPALPSVQCWAADMPHHLPIGYRAASHLQLQRSPRPTRGSGTIGRSTSASRLRRAVLIHAMTAAS